MNNLSDEETSGTNSVPVEVDPIPEVELEPSIWVEQTSKAAGVPVKMKITGGNTEILLVALTIGDNPVIPISFTAADWFEMIQRNNWVKEPGG